jgi:hypothetical protein
MRRSVERGVGKASLVTRARFGAKPDFEPPMNTDANAYTNWAKVRQFKIGSLEFAVQFRGAG